MMASTSTPINVAVQSTLTENLTATIEPNNEQTNAIDSSTTSSMNNIHEKSTF